MNQKRKQVAVQRPAGKIVLLLLALLAVVIAGGFILQRGGTGTPSEVSDAPVEVVEVEKAEVAITGTLASKPANLRPSFSKLLGGWVREDGGYVLKITEVTPDGKLSAAYFNPNPIHVSQALAVEEGGNVKVGIELNDVNYPGCLYTLVLNRELDQLQGTYFQAALGQTYQITFVRMPEE